MKTLLTCVACLVSVTATAQTTNFNQPPHIETALNHFTVIDPVEPITRYAIADHSSFEIESRGDKLFLEPLRENVATNLFIWTASRELVYEIDPAGEVAKMNMLIRNAPPPGQTTNHGTATPAPVDQDIRQSASLALTQALIDIETISNDDQKPRPGEVSVRLEEVLRSKDEMYIRYSVVNLSSSPYRLTSPDVSLPLPAQTPISTLSLRNHQLTEQTFSTFKASHGSMTTVIHSELQTHDLAPGQTTTGIISIRSSATNPPQLYQLTFGVANNRSLTVEAVL